MVGMAMGGEPLDFYHVKEWLMRTVVQPIVDRGWGGYCGIVGDGSPMSALVCCRLDTTGGKSQWGVAVPSWGNLGDVIMIARVYQQRVEGP